MQDAALILGGVVGGATAVVHGVLTQRFMTAPIAAIAKGRVSDTIARLWPAILQFSTFNWLVSGVALIAAAVWLGAEAKIAIGLLVGSSYAFAAIGNFWATRGRHPGWILMTLALVAIGVGLTNR
jgi:hypothetical protein